MYFDVDDVEETDCLEVTNYNFPTRVFFVPFSVCVVVCE